MARLIVLDSDDEDDDFPSLRPPMSTRRATRPVAKDVAKTPVRKLATTSDKIATAPKSTVRRRKLGRIDNDESLLRPWTAGNSKQQRQDLPEKPRESLASRRPKPRVELRTRRTRRISDLPADNDGELSTEEASVLEDVTVGHNTENEDRSRKEVSKEDDEDDDCNNGDNNVGEHDKDEDSDKDEDGDEDEDDDDDDDDDTSEFLDSSSDGDFSIGSLDDFFSSPSKNKAATQPRTTASRTSRERRSPAKKTPVVGVPQPQEKPADDNNEESTVFFSAEESLVDVTDALAKPLLGLSLDDPSIATENQERVSERVSRPATPPRRLPPKKTQTAGLVSPTKKLPHIPMTPHRVSSNDFWDQQVVDNWNMEHSPMKLLFDDSIPKKKKGTEGGGGGGGATSPRKNPAAAKDREAKKAFQKAKHEMAETFLAELDRVLTKGELARLAEATGGVRIIWTNKLNTTAGRANWRRETLRKRDPATVAAATSSSSMDSSVSRVLHHASIELAEKVIDDEHRLLNVIAHEFCHLANFMVSGVTGNPHGREFKAWAALCSRHFGASHGIQVTTKHAYEIDFKYVWTCSECAAEFKRHSKSIDPGRHRCGVCRGPLQQTKPVPRGTAAAAAAQAGGSKKGGAALGGGGGTQVAPQPSEYQKFMKEHMAVVRKENPGSPQKVIMKLVADKWTQAKAAKAAKLAGRAEAKPDDDKENTGASQSKTELSKKGVGEAGVDAGMDRLDKVFVDLTLD